MQTRAALLMKGCGNAATWAEVAAHVGVTIDAVKKIFDPSGPNARRWDEAEAALVSVKK